MSGPEFNPRDDEPIDREEYEKAMRKKIPRIEDDEVIVAAIREGRHAEDIYLLDCPWCGVPSYYNQGSHFTCRICDRTVQVTDDDSGNASSVSSMDAITLAEYWESAPYPCDEKMRIELCNCTTVLLGEAADKRITQKSIALTYAMAIQSSEQKDWKVINDAIIARWSRSGLERIKRAAWKLVEKNAR